MRAAALLQVLLGLLLVAMSVRAHAQSLPAEAHPVVETSLDEQAIFQNAGFSERTSLLLGRCPFHTAFANRVDLLRQIERPLELDKVRRVNEDVRRCVGTLPGSTGACTEMLCRSLIDIFELPVSHVMSPAALARKRQQEEAKHTQEQLDFTTVGGVLVLLFTLAAVVVERWWRNP